MKIFMIAGETSGDAIGGPLIEALKVANPDIECAGIGGPEMKKAGMDIRMDMEAIAVMGILEILPELPRLWKIYKGTIAEIKNYDPDIILTIDSPDFNFHVARKLKKDPDIRAKMVHIVAPTVWAWRPGRAKWIAGFLDGLVCLFPFEPRYFKPHELNTIYMGHPLIEQDIDSVEGQAFRHALEIEDNDIVVGLLFGSRESEVKMMGPIMKQAAILLQQKLQEQGKVVHFIIPTIPAREYQVRNLMGEFEGFYYVIPDPEKKWHAFKSCDFAMAVSGTVVLELSFAKVPHILTYRTSMLTATLVRCLIKTPFAHLVNVAFEKGLIPEFIQRKCTPDILANESYDLLMNPEALDKQIRVFDKARDVFALKDGKTTPSQKAAAFILKLA